MTPSRGFPVGAWHLRPTWSSSASAATTFSFRSRNSLSRWSRTRLEAEEATTRLTQARTALQKTKEEENATRESVKQLGKSEADLSANVATLERRQRDLETLD